MKKYSLNKINRRDQTMTDQKSSIMENDCKIDWQEYLSSDDNINHLFKSIGLDKYEISNIKTRYVIDNQRYGAMVIVKNTETGHLSKIIIDAASTNPTWAQLMDVTYNLGADCEKRIILFDDYFNDSCEYKLNFDYEVAQSFAQFNNAHNIETYIIEIPESNDDATEDSIIYEINARPDDAKRDDCKDPLSKHDMEVLLFWIIYYSVWINDLSLIFNPKEWRDQCGNKMFEDIEYELDWNEDGAFLYTTVDTRFVNVEWLILNHYNELHDEINNFVFTIDKKSDTQFLISFKLLDKPFTDFIHGTTAEKYNLVETLWWNEAKTFGLFETITHKMKEYDQAVNS